VDALVGATVVDVVSGRSIRNGVVLIRDGRILAVGSGDELGVPAGARRTDLAGRWVVPGFIDAHAHLQPWGLTASLAHGVTTVRDLHAGEPLARALTRAAQAAGGPRLFQAIAMVDAAPTTYPDAIPVDSAGAAAAVDRAARLGAGWIKAYTRITPEQLEEVVIAARASRLPVAAHLGLTDALTAAQLGVRSIEHLSGIPEALGMAGPLQAAHAMGFFQGWTAFAQSWSVLDTLALDRLARELAATGVILVPTLGLHDTFARLDDSLVYRSPALAAVPDSARTNWNVPGMIARAGWTRNDYPIFRAGRPVQDRFVHSFAAAGGVVATGTDASNQLLVPGAGVHLEMELLVHAGLEPLEALRAATLHGATLLMADSLGRLQPNAVADLVVLGGDPLADIRNTRQVVRVMAAGRWVE
jgi:imidazolonepropionase-like amidohydrolase